MREEKGIKDANFKGILEQYLFGVVVSFHTIPSQTLRPWNALNIDVIL